MADAQHLRRLNELLEQALQLPLEARAAWLARRPEGERPFVPELTQLLARAVIETDTFMRQPAVAALDELAAAEARADEPGDQIGPWRLLQPLGEGGMARVWQAERADGTLTREVALKLPRLGLRVGLAQRMARERDLLAALEHPHIARLYDAGVTADGRPWLAMESVAGEPIDAHVRRLQLEPAAVLRLVLQVCDALAHAHARLIVHRDLKPANILVTAEGQVRLLDFGVGKMLQGETDPAVGAPQLTQLIGGAWTPDYASPEQIAGRPVTVATDVYSLGVVLYELLSGQRPYRLGRQSTAALEEAILAADVPAASQRCADRARARALRGDLDAVLAKALAKNPARRYASVESFAADLQAHLEGRPVQAQPARRLYRLGKFVRRNRWPLTMAAAVALSLLIGLLAALWQAREARLEAQRAHQARQFITGLLRDAQPRQGGAAAGAVRSADLLVRAGERIETELADDPRQAAELGILVGEQLAFLGEPQRGEAALRAAVERAMRTLGPRHPTTLKGRALLASSLSLQHPEEARRLTEALVPDALAGLPDTAADAVFALRSQSFLLAKQGQAEASIGVLRQAVAVAEQHLGADHVQTLTSLGLLSNTLGRFRQFGEQLTVASEAMRRAQASLGAARPHNTLTAVERWYAEALRRNDRPADAVPILRQTVQDQRALDGADTPRVRNMLYQLGLALGESGRLGEGIELLQRVVAMEAQQNTVLNEDRLSFRRALRVLLGFARRGTEVQAVTEDLVALQPAGAAASGSAAGHKPDAAEVLGRARQARVLAYQGLFESAEAEAAGLLNAVAPLQPPEPGLHAEVWHAHALAARLQGRHALAQQHAATGWEAAHRLQARPAAQAALASEWAAAAFELGDFARAEAMQREAMALWRRAQVDPSPLSATALVTQARLQLRAGQAAQALATLEPLVAAWAEAHPGSAWHAEARHWRGQALAAMGRRAEALADRAAARPALLASRVPALRRLAAL